MADDVRYTGGQWYANGHAVQQGAAARGLTPEEQSAVPKVLHREFVRLAASKFGMSPRMDQLYAARDRGNWIASWLIATGPFSSIPNGEHQDIRGLACFAAWYANLSDAGRSAFNDDVQGGHCYQYCPAAVQAAQASSPQYIYGVRWDPAYQSHEGLALVGVNPFDPGSALTIDGEIQRNEALIAQQKAPPPSLLPKSGMDAWGSPWGSTELGRVGQQFVQGNYTGGNVPSADPGQQPPQAQASSVWPKVFAVGLLVAGIGALGGLLWMAHREL